MTTPGLEDEPPTLFSSRRAAVFAALDEGVMVLCAAPVQFASRDTERPYAPDRELYYVTGATEPETVAVLVGGAEPELVLFVPERDPEAELWAGPRLGPEEAAERFAPDRCLPRSELDDRLPELLERGRRIHARLGRGGAVERAVIQALARARVRGGRAGTGPRGVVDPGEILDDLRLVKGAEELARLRRAAEISEVGHRAGIDALAPGVGEWEVQGAIDGAFRSAGAIGPAYETIVGSGANACVLHYVRNGDRIAPDALVLVDAGAQFGLYNADITRTYPASGRFTEPQRDVYDIVDAARAAGIGAARPGATILDVHEAALTVLVEGLVGLGVLSGAVDDLVAEGAHKAYFPHQTSHWLGLDVHDVGDYARDGASRVLEPGMVFTVEPGLYFPPEVSEGGAAEYAGIGVRVEDDVAVTEDGHEVLTATLPTGSAEIEEVVRAAR